MSDISKLRESEIKLQKRYKQLIEEAYNFSQTDSALSDISEFKAIKLLDKLNKIRFLKKDSMQVIF